MKLSLCLLLLAVVSIQCVPLASFVDPPLQYVPLVQPTPDNKFNNGTSRDCCLPHVTLSPPVPPEYGLRNADIPFGRMYMGKAKYFVDGETNQAGSNKDVWNPGKNDYASQSACGIPNNAFFISHAAIHPYFLKYADLNRYCMQDVCISFWGASGHDGMVKVTDICSTDPTDESYCETPNDLKLDRKKVEIVETNAATHTLNGTEYPTDIFWWFTKCWADGLAQTTYNGTNTENWFTTPPLPNFGAHGQTTWSWNTTLAQMKQNQKTYASKGWPVYNNKFYQANAANFVPIPDWEAGDPEPEWCPVAGGKGHGHPTGNCSVQVAIS